ncbi:unnamed protein product [Brassica napus]|uniref:(rape) hypothetical protein n=1 Tax=Brassica napus TaxID=3708 RepID=A0A816IDY7_BRANA|nr:unnamed protein product [Brassica napus]
MTNNDPMIGHVHCGCTEVSYATVSFFSSQQMTQILTSHNLKKTCSFPQTPHRRRLAATTTTANVECHKQVRSWRLLCTIVQVLIPSCYCTLVDPNDNQEDKSHHQIKPRTSSTTTQVSSFTGTIFGFRRGKVNFCIQATNSKTLNPIIILLELTVPTEVLAHEMQGGVLINNRS